MSTLFDTGLSSESTGHMAQSGAGDHERQSAKFRGMTVPRKRAVTACETCRVKKSKCDNQRPRCSSCVKHEWPCSYDPRLDHSSFDPASLMILGKLDETLQHLRNISNGLGGSDPPSGWTGRALELANSVKDSPTLNPGTGSDLWSSSSDSLEVPTTFGSAVCVLSWPIFGNRWPQTLLSQEILACNISSPLSTQRSSSGGGKRSMHGINEDSVPNLVERFLQLVHSKNPILEARQLREAARKVAEHGVSWDASSCIVLLACALGAIARPFDSSYEAGQLNARSSLQDLSDVREEAEIYYQAARKRLGLIDPGMVAGQCHMLSGIYLMYRLRPLQAWTAFHQAGSVYSLYLKSQAASGGRSGSTSAASAPVQAMRRLEQRLYWTVLKSECELRVHLDLPQSELCKTEYPDLFPSPPTPSSPAWSPPERFPNSTPASTTTNISQAFSMTSTTSSQYSEEQSWFYYLSEISLRRSENRVLNTFYRYDNRQWSQMNLSSMIRAVEEIESQLQNWSSSLPDIIRIDNLGPNQALDELRYFTSGRELSIRALAYRPFLYYAIHCTRDRAHYNNDTHVALQALVQKSLHTCVAINTGNSIPHRHHGTWYGLRECAGSAIMLLAAKMGGLITTLVDSPSSSNGGQAQENEYGRAVQHCIERLRYWEAEAPADISKVRAIVEELYASAKSLER